MIIQRKGFLGLTLKCCGYVLSIDSGEGYSLYTRTPPLGGESEEEGEYGPFRWSSFEVPGPRGSIRAYLVEAKGIKVLHTGGLTRRIDLPEADVLAVPAGGLWYLDAREACKLFKEGKWRALVPLALWEPGIKAHFDTVNTIREVCRGLRRVRPGRSWKVTFDPVKGTLVLLSAGPLL